MRIQTEKPGSRMRHHMVQSLRHAYSLLFFFSGPHFPSSAQERFSKMVALAEQMDATSLPLDLHSGQSSSSQYIRKSAAAEEGWEWSK